MFFSFFEFSKRRKELKEEQKFFLDIGIVSKIFSLWNTHFSFIQVERIFMRFSAQSASERKNAHPKKKILSL